MSAGAALLWAAALHTAPAGAAGRPQRAHIPLWPAFSIHFVDSHFVSAFRMPLRRDPKAL
jgi:hypothetical protein